MSEKQFDPDTRTWRTSWRYSMRLDQALRVAARRVSPGGHAYGIDMTDEMLWLANGNKEKAGVTNATFLRGTIENVPLPNSSVDVVISNCVINLAEDKGAVIKEAFRVLRPGGLFAVADMVELEPLDATTKKQLDSWAGC